jgi:mannose-6-phosphate isomerase-like protein (cupin superfamily)
MSEQWTKESMEQRVVRYQDLRACRNAFVDTYTPGSDQKENFTVIGPGVAEHPDQHVHISEAHGFNIGGARQPPGCNNSQHSHETEEVFIVHTGQWAFRWGEKCEQGEAVLGPGDCISIPVNVFRGFENVGDGTGYLFAVLGGDDPGRVLWAPEVFEQAKDYGLVLLENGRLVDTTKGETIPEGVIAMPATTVDQVNSHRVMSVAEMLDCVYPQSEQRDRAGSALCETVEGVTESPMIGLANPAEGIAAGKMAWPHGFHVRRFDMAAQSEIGLHSRSEEEVFFVQSGNVDVQWEGGELSLGTGDVITVPVGLAHGYRNTSDEPVLAYVVRGGNSPAAPTWALDQASSAAS